MNVDADHQRQGMRLLSAALRGSHRGRLAIVSSFGAESAVLLALAAEIDPDVPVLFLDTGRHFPETLDYREHLAARLGLRNVRDIWPPAAEVAAEDPLSTLAGTDPDACCALRKARPLARALAPFAAWASGRKRYQAPGRAAVPFAEVEGGRLKLNPLADWTASEVAAAHRARDLPSHPLVALGYGSIGCAPCTRAVAADEARRAGRWPGRDKTECGIHDPADVRPALV